jgi:D-alanyl-D-alanine dipeptidase
MGLHDFVGPKRHDELDCAWLHHLAATGLACAVAALHRLASGHHLLVLDALRPHRVPVEPWEFHDGTGLRQDVADPPCCSIHSLGMALDVTIVGPGGDELDMGSGFDKMDELSPLRLEAAHLASGALTSTQVANSEPLRRVMAHGGFNGIDNEWRQFDMFDRGHVRETFLRVE